MEIRPLDLDDLPRWHEAFTRGWQHDRPWEAMLPFDHFDTIFRQEMSSEINEGFAAYDGHDIVGGGWLRTPLIGNTDNVEFTFAVTPEHRRRGVGSALAEYAVRRVEESGGTYALTMSSYPLAERETHGFRVFAERLGFAIDLEEIHRMLPLPVDEGLLGKLAEEAAHHHDGYRIETWVDDVPEAHLDSWLKVHNLLSLDAPQGVVPWEEDALDRAAHEEQVGVFRATGRTFISSVAISPDDEVVAYSDLLLRGGGSDKVSQWGTLVRREHRGHRLGTAVKVANLLRLQADHPDRTEVHTTNAEVNAAMIGINEVLGFRAVAVHPCFYRKVR